MNGLFNKFYEDDRLNPNHITTYLALFQFWNLNRFQNPFFVARYDIMKLAKVKPPNTYCKCLNELMKWGYINYEPSYNPYVGGSFNLVNFCTSTNANFGKALIRGYTNNDQALTASNANNEQALANSIANNGKALIPSKRIKLNYETKEREISPSLNLIIEFFIFFKSTKNEAQKYWNYYESTGWLVGGKIPMVDWQASAHNWIIQSKDLNGKAPVQKMDYLHTNNKKRYDEPL